MKNPPQRVTRRTFLGATSAAGLLAVSGPPWLRAAVEAAQQDWRAGLLRYCRSLAQPDGGYGWPEQNRSHLTATWAVVGCHRLLEKEVPRRKELIEFVHIAHPQRGRKPEHPLRQFDYQQVQCLLWLGDDAAESREKIRTWTTPIDYPRQYEPDGNPPVAQEVAVVLCRELLQLPIAPAAASFNTFLDARRRTNGSFNHAPASAGGDGHVMVTWWALQALRALGRGPAMAEETIAWLRACQLPNGGFTYQPKPAIAGVDDVAYTWAALNALTLLKSRPADPAAAARYLWSLRNGDGGFGDRPGWRSNPLATFYAVSSLAALNFPADESRDSTREKPRAVLSALPTNLRVWTIQLEAPGHGSPWEAVDLARALRVHLWGAKNAPPGWIARAQAIADAQQAPVKFCVADEEYGTFFRLPGLGTYSHISDLFAPAGVDFGPNLAKQSSLTWEQFRERRAVPLEKAGGRLFWQFGENEEFVRVLLDDSLARGGYAAISTFHFGNPDFTTSQPFLNRYRGHLPFVALQDAHGAESWWWSDQLTGFRTVFLATEPTWEGWLNALKRDWVMSIRHDAVSGNATWLHGGASGVRELVIERAADWQWWGDRAEQNRRPLVSIVPVRANDEFEVGRPEHGLNLRVRCAWQNTTQGLPKEPLMALVSLAVDGRTVLTGETISRSARTPRNARGARTDAYHLHSLEGLSAGQHTAIATAREVATGRTIQRTIQFKV